MIAREKRFSGRFGAKERKDFRQPFQRDCDRLLYSAALRRLAVITQVASPAGGHAFHNRLTHALKVAQVGSRIAERIAQYRPPRFFSKFGGLQPDVVIAAGLAHDLGHPPFGHIAEEELNRCLLDAGEADGYEGNAQSFRIVTKIEVRESGTEASGPLGLDLTRASLKAILKYPWFRPPKRPRGDVHPKFGAYRSEGQQFKFATRGSTPRKRSLEAEIMDWADDITYAVHDLEDFYRVGMIPLDRLANSEAAVEDFLEQMFRRKRDKINKSEHSDYMQAAKRLFEFSPVSQPYTGSRAQKAALRSLASRTIRTSVNAAWVSQRGFEVKENARRDVAILKELTWQFVIENPRMAPQQEGKRKIICELFRIFGDAASSKKTWKMFPPPFQEQLEFGEVSPERTTSDFIASLGEQRAVELFQKSPACHSSR